MTFDRFRATPAASIAALALAAGCAGSPTPLSPSATPAPGAPAGRFSQLTRSSIRTLAEFPVSTTGAATTTSAPCAPLPSTTGDPGAMPSEAAPAGDTPAPPAPMPYDGYYSLRQGRIQTLEEGTPAASAATLPCATVQITIAGSVGAAAFDPNPRSAQVGDLIVWANNDLRPHKIIVDDGTPTGLVVGDLLPGATSAPFPLTTPTANFHCEYHPSMVGTISSALPASIPGTGMPASTDPAAPAPAADPAYTPPMDDRYAY